MKTLNNALFRIAELSSFFYNACKTFNFLLQIKCKIYSNRGKNIEGCGVIMHSMNLFVLFWVSPTSPPPTQPPPQETTTHQSTIKLNLRRFDQIEAWLQPSKVERWKLKCNYWKLENLILDLKILMIGLFL